MRQVIASGGILWDDPRSETVYRYILAQAGKSYPRVCYIPTASGDAESAILQFYKAFASLDCRPSYLSLFNPHTSDIAAYLLAQDILFVGGGSTRSMLAVWKEWGLGQIFRQAWEQGILLAGSSAGGMCWFEDSLTEALPGQYASLQGIGLLKGSFCPHYDTPAGRESYIEKIKSGEVNPGYGVEDGPALHFVDGQLHRVVSPVDGKNVFHLSFAGESVQEKALQVELLTSTE